MDTFALFFEVSFVGKTLVTFRDYCGGQREGCPLPTRGNNPYGGYLQFGFVSYRKDCDDDGRLGDHAVSAKCSSSSAVSEILVDLVTLTVLG
jgi:hypothetical protein